VPTGYLDVVPDASGFRHIALFSPADTAEPVFLTRGQWEVVGAIERVDLGRRLMCAAVRSP
jgi:dipeptidyl aminopeptidase